MSFLRYRILLQKIFNAGKEFKDFQNKLRTGLVENYDAVYVERKNQNCLWLKGFIREMSKIQIKKYRFFIRHYWRINNFMIFCFWKNGNYLKANLLKCRDAKREEALTYFGRCLFCMQKWVRKLAGTGSLYTNKSRMKKA